MSALPLAGKRVLDIATFLAAPFCGTVLADFGAEVIKIEQPGKGDPLRGFGTHLPCGDTLVWLSEARNKLSVTLDLRTPRGADLFRDLVRQSDVVLENFRPGTLEKWGLGYEALAAINPSLVMLRISAYGQTGPYAKLPGFARVAHGFSGLSDLAGEEDGPPVVPGSTSLADYASGLWGALGVLLALRVAERDGKGQVIDIGLYESIFRLLDELAPAYAKFGEIRKRLGADVAHVAPHGHWQAEDGKWIALACSSDKIFERMARLMERADLLGPGMFATNPERIARRLELNGIVGDWVARKPAEAVVDLCNAAGVPCGPILNIADIFAHPQYAARGNIVTHEDPRAGPIALPAAMPRLTATPARLDHAGPALGAHTDTILADLLGLDADAIATLRAAGVI